MISPRRALAAPITPVSPGFGTLSQNASYWKIKIHVFRIIQSLNNIIPAMNTIYVYRLFTRKFSEIRSSTSTDAIYIIWEQSFSEPPETWRIKIFGFFPVPVVSLFAPLKTHINLCSVSVYDSSQTLETYLFLFCSYFTIFRTNICFFHRFFIKINE